jgi:hypothetical protein
MGGSQTVRRGGRCHVDRSRAGRTPEGRRSPPRLQLHDLMRCRIQLERSAEVLQEVQAVLI